MDRQGVESFLSKFTSRKNNPETAIGRFGIGSFSVAAIPGQCGFNMLTSTGQETWRLGTGSLLVSQPIVLERISPVQPTGTRFSITFQRDKSSLVEELQKLQEVARKYLYHLPINVFFAVPGRGAESPASTLPDWIPGNWIQDPDERFPKRFCLTLNGHVFDVVMGVGRARQQLYQRRVLITEDRSDHDLLSQDLLPQKLSINHLSIRVDSPQFEMPLGRHCLSDSRLLIPLARHLREHILPQYLEELVQIYETSSTAEFFINPSEIEDMLSTWMATSPKDLPERFRNVSIFGTHDGHRLSYEAICQAAKAQGVVYLEAGSASGLDYSAFDAPVLSVNQPARGLQLIRGQLGEVLVDLSVADLVQEAPPQARRALSTTEQRFAKALGFTPEALAVGKQGAFINRIKNSCAGHSPNDGCPPLPEKVASHLRRELRNGCDALQQIKWDLGHLVKQDGKTPCKTVLFLNKGNRLVLNLYHRDILKLVALSEKDPNLAGHFATALCLSRDGRGTILSYIPPERREALIYLDAICRCGRANRALSKGSVTHKKSNGVAIGISLKDFLRRISEDDFRS
jgi:hypothetical protein